MAWNPAPAFQLNCEEMFPARAGFTGAPDLLWAGTVIETAVLCGHSICELVKVR
jgi:hypothetical protein